MQRDGGGIFNLVAEPFPGTCYRVDGEGEDPDPASRYQP